MKRRRYLNPPDNRPLDDWGLPIGKPYEKKKWEELTPEEMTIDFEWKSDILEAYGDEVSSDTFYQDYLFRELYEGELEAFEERGKVKKYKVMLTEYDAKDSTKVHKIDVEDIYSYLHLNDVAISPCLFYRNWRRKNLLNYVSAFVLDIDKLRPKQLQRFLMLFDEGRLLRPTFIANSGSGVHFYYLLDKMLPIDSVQHEANKLIAEEIYTKLYDDVIKKEKWEDAQRHWIGQDYRVVNSRTKLNQVAQIFKVGEIYTIEKLITHYNIMVNRKKKYASKKMVSYAGSIAKSLNITPPDYSDAGATYKFIAENKDAAYQVREERRQIREAKRKKRAESAKNKPKSWYKNTLYYMRDNTKANFRYSSMKALAMIAFKEQVPREIFVADLYELSAYWQTCNWGGDNFNPKNVPAIERFFDQGRLYGNVSPEKLEEWLGYKFNRIGVQGRKKPLPQEAHLKAARMIRDLQMSSEGRNWDDNNGRKPKLAIVQKFRYNNPKGRKIDCERETGLSRHTVLKWWEAADPRRLHKMTPSSPLLQQMLLDGLRELEAEENNKDRKEFDDE